MSERGRVVLIFAAVLLLAGGAGFYFFKIYRPAKDLENARAEIAGWELRWQAARDCLLGKSPGSAKTSEALAIHEMAPDPWDRGKCTPLISKLTRGESVDSGVPAIETAWEALDKAAQDAAKAFAQHVGSSTTLVADPLPSALDALDTARSNLRTAATLPAAERAGGRLPTAQIVQLLDGTDPVTSLEIDAIPSSRGMVLFGKTANRLIQLMLTTGGSPQVARIGPTALRGVPDTSWGAVAAEGEVQAGPFDGEGAPSTWASLKLADRSTVAAVIGSRTLGTIVYGTPTQLYVAHAKDGAVTADPAIDIAWAMASTDVDGRAVVLWQSSKDKKYQARIIKPGDDGAIAELPEALSGQPCLTKDRAWVQSNREVFSFGGGQPLFRKEASGDFTKLQGCSADAALFRDVAVPKMLYICADDCRKVQVPPGAPETAATTVVRGKLVAIAAHNGVLGVWREGGQPTFYSMPEAAQPVLAQELTAMAMTDGKVIDIIARGAKTFVVIRIPAT